MPYQHAVRLHDALTKAGVPNQLLTIPGGGHGNFTPEQRTRIYVTIREFLGETQAPVRVEACRRRYACLTPPGTGHTLCGRGVRCDID